MFMTFKKKSHPKFNVPNYGAKSRKGVKERWRKQRGIDNKKRVKKAFMGAEPTIGYRNPAAIRHMRGSGKRAALIRNVSDIEAFHGRKMHETHDAIIVHAVSKRTRRLILEAAKKHGIEVANPGIGLAKKEEGKEKQEAKGSEATKPIKATPPQEKKGAVNEH